MMRGFVRKGIFAGGYVLFAFGFATFWWRMWFYRGWTGPPQLLIRLFGADGEAAYDTVMIEMFLICLIFICVLVPVLRAAMRIRSERGRLG